VSGTKLGRFTEQLRQRGHDNVAAAALAAKHARIIWVLMAKEAHYQLAK